MASTLIRTLLAGGSLLALSAGVAPQAALGAAVPPRQITINITDKGFDKQDYTVGYSGSTADDGAVVIFTNNGTTVHSAESVPGALDMGATFGAATTAAGTTIPCRAPLPCAKLGRTSTGGIEPGGSVTLGFQVIKSGADYTLTSAPDCLFGNNSSTFNCQPVTLHLVPIASRSPISGTMGGSVIRAAGSKDCDPTTQSPDPSICFSDVRDPGTIQGSPTKPLSGSVTVNITDTGFDPTTLYVSDGTTVTWVNKGSLVHSLNEKPFTSGPYNGFDFIGPIGLGPGDTYSYNFHMYNGWRAQKGTSISANVVSFTHADIVPSSAGTTGSGAQNQGCRARQECGQPGLISKVITVPTKDSVS